MGSKNSTNDPILKIEPGQKEVETKDKEVNEDKEEKKYETVTDVSVAIKILEFQIRRVECDIDFHTSHLNGVNHGIASLKLKHSIIERGEMVKRYKNLYEQLKVLTEKENKEKEEEEKKRQDYFAQKPPTLKDPSFELKIIDFKLARLEIDISFHLQHLNNPSTGGYAKLAYNQATKERDVLMKQREQLLIEIEKEKVQVKE
jgi:hypothetical protein